MKIQKNEQYKSITITTEDETTIIAAKLDRIYDEELGQYDSFITPEAYQALQDYNKFREEHGEKINGESLLIRDTWRTVDVKGRGGRNRDLATVPKQITRNAIIRIIRRGLEVQRIRSPLLEGMRRYETKTSHGFRKFFDTTASQAGMLTDNVEILMGHNRGVRESYNKPPDMVLLEDYLKAVPSLTINYDADRSVLQKEVAELKEKSEHQNYVIKGLA